MGEPNVREWKSKGDDSLGEKLWTLKSLICICLIVPALGGKVLGPAHDGSKKRVSGECPGCHKRGGFYCHSKRFWCNSCGMRSVDSIDLICIKKGLTIPEAKEWLEWFVATGAPKEDKE